MELKLKIELARSCYILKWHCQIKVTNHLRSEAAALVVVVRLLFMFEFSAVYIFLFSGSVESVPFACRSKFASTTQIFQQTPFESCRRLYCSCLRHQGIVIIVISIDQCFVYIFIQNHWNPWKANVLHCRG